MENEFQIWLFIRGELGKSSVSRFLWFFSLVDVIQLCKLIFDKYDNLINISISILN